MSAKVQNVLRGADPELFLRDSVTNEPVTAIGLIGGSKAYPRDIGGGFAVQEDNVAVEFNIPPAKTSQEFKASLQHVLTYLSNTLNPQGLVLDISPTSDFTPEQLEHPQAQELGCEPDYNAWTRDVNPRPKAPPSLRSSGGHLHIGYDNPNEETSLELIKAHDLFCGVASIVYDGDVRRREVYGKAGAHRIKGYGVEYRTLSNFWIKTPELMEWLFAQSEKAVNFVNEGNVIDDVTGQMIADCINNGNMDLVAKLDAKYGVL